VRDALCRAAGCGNSAACLRIHSPGSWPLRKIAHSMLCGANARRRTFAPELGTLIESKWTLAPVVEEIFAPLSRRDPSRCSMRSARSLTATALQDIRSIRLRSANLSFAAAASKAAREYFRAAFALARNPRERRFLGQRVVRCQPYGVCRTIAETGDDLCGKVSSRMLRVGDEIKIMPHPGSRIAGTCLARDCEHGCQPGPPTGSGQFRPLSGMSEGSTRR
jgi:hypothetical protein